MAKIISVINQKGGVGKTTTAINLSSALATLGNKVLLVDMDAQANSSRGLGIDNSLMNYSVFDLFSSDIDVKEVIKHTFPNLDLLPSKLKLFEFESDDYFVLKNKLAQISERYDFIIIDCPPSLGYLTINALVASNSVIIPLQCEYFAMDAISQLLPFISKIQKTYNPELEIEGFLFTMIDMNTKNAVETSQQLRSIFKENILYTTIPRNVSLPESNSNGKPVVLYRPKSKGAQAYIALAKEILEKK